MESVCLTASKCSIFHKLVPFQKSHRFRDNFLCILTLRKIHRHIFLEFTEYFQTHFLIFDSQYHWEVL